MSDLDVSDLLTVQQAIRILDSVPVVPRPIRVPLAQAEGLRLARSLSADRDYPPFDKSQMDGYAVRRADVATLPADLRKVGEVAAGQQPDRPVGPGEAIAIMTGLLEVDENFYIARRYRAMAYLLSGDPERAVSDLHLLPQERSEDPSFRLPMLGRAYADMGESARAEKVFNTLALMARTDYVVSWNLAVVAAGLRRYEDAMTYLEAAYAHRESTLPFLRSLHWFAAIAGTLRFQSLLTKIGPTS